MTKTAKKSGDSAALQALEMSGREMAATFGITQQRLNQLAGENVVSRTSRGRFNVKKSVAGYIAFLRDENKRRTQSASATKLNEAKADLIRVQVEEKTGKLIEAARAEAVSAADQIIGEFKADLNAIPARVTVDLALRRKIEDEIDRLYRAAAERCQRHVEGLDEKENEELVTARDKANADTSVENRQC